VTYDRSTDNYNLRFYSGLASSLALHVDSGHAVRRSQLKLKTMKSMQLFSSFCGFYVHLACIASLLPPCCSDRVDDSGEEETVSPEISRVGPSNNT